MSEDACKPSKRQKKVGEVAFNPPFFTLLRTQREQHPNTDDTY